MLLEMPLLLTAEQGDPLLVASSRLVDNSNMVRGKQLS